MYNKWMFNIIEQNIEQKKVLSYNMLNKFK